MELDWIGSAITGASLGLSVLATWVALRSDARSRKLELRQDRKALRDEVHFEVLRVELVHRDEVQVTLVHRGDRTAQWVRIDPASVVRHALTVQLHMVLWEPGETASFRYQSRPHATLESVKLIWQGPGTGEQRITIPPPDDA